MRNRSFTLLILSSLFVTGGCQEPTATSARLGTSVSTPVQTPPATATPLPPAPAADTSHWTASATVDAVALGSAPPCGWGTSLGDTRSGVAWRVIVIGSTISLDEDMRNWPTDDIPFSGALDSAQFNASYKSASDYANYICQFREGALTGRFTSDSTFDAVETLIWGTPATQTTVVRHWKGTRL